MDEGAQARGHDPIRDLFQQYEGVQESVVGHADVTHHRPQKLHVVMT